MIVDTGPPSAVENKEIKILRDMKILTNKNIEHSGPHIAIFEKRNCLTIDVRKGKREKYHDLINRYLSPESTLFF